MIFCVIGNNFIASIHKYLRHGFSIFNHLFKKTIERLLKAEQEAAQATKDAQEAKARAKAKAIAILLSSIPLMVCAASDRNAVSAWREP